MAKSALARLPAGSRRALPSMVHALRQSLGAGPALAGYRQRMKALLRYIGLVTAGTALTLAALE